MSATRTFDPDPDADRTRAHERADATAGYPGVPPTPAPVSSPPGYEIVGELGRGGMGVVYDAVQTTINRPCALKMVLGSGHAGSVALVRFLAEAEAVAAIDHPHVVRVFEFGNHGGQPFLAMERLDGGSLADRLKATGPLPVAEAVTLLEKIAAGVQAGHDLGIVHRDLKPANILLAADGTPKVTDFGLAKRDSGGDLTATNAMMGTPEYMSPEQAKGQTKFVGPTADVYSLGAILYATLSGRPPFQCPSVYDLRLKVINEDAPSLTKVAPSVPRDLAIIAAKCLAKDPAERYPTATAFADDLRRWRTGDTIVARAASNQERAWKAAKRNRGLVTATGTVVLALCVGMAATSVAAVRALAEAKRADGEAAKAVDAAERADGETMKAVDAAERADGETFKAVQAALDANTEKFKAHAETLRAEKQLDRAERLVYASQINSTDRTFRTGAIAVAVRLLDLTRWDLRGWEHDYFTTQFHAGHVTLAGYTEGVNSVAFSPDGSRIASAGRDKSVTLWDAATGREQRILTGHTDWVNSVSFSPDGSRIASASEDKSLKLWEVASGRELQTLAGHTESVKSVAFSPDGARLASASRDKSVRLWDAATGREQRTLAGHTRGVNSVSFSPDGSRIASASDDKSLKLWDVVSGREQRTLNGHSGSVTSVAFSPDGTRVASVGGFTVRLWDAATGREQRTLEGHTWPDDCVAFSPDGTRVASAGIDTVALWDAATGRKQRTLAGHTRGVNSVSFSPDGSRLASAGNDAGPKLWDVTPVRKPEPRMRDMFEGGSRDHAVSPGGTLVASAGEINTVEVRDARTGGGRRTLVGHKNRVTRVAFSSDGTRVASASMDGTVRLWVAATGREQSTLTGHYGFVNDVCFSPDGAQVASASGDKTIKLWDATTGREQRTLTGHTMSVVSAAFSPEGDRIASADWNGNVKLWDATSGQELCNLGSIREGSPSLSTYALIRFSSDSRDIVINDSIICVNFWHAILQSYDNEIRIISSAASKAFAVTKSGHQLVAKSHNTELTVWSLITGQLLEGEPIPAGLTFVTRADLPDGKRIAFVEGGKIVVRDKAKYAAFQAEMARRLAEYAKPKPDWHAKSFDEAVAAKDGFAARFHLGYLRKIKGDADPAVTSREPLLPKEVVPKPGS